MAPGKAKTIVKRWDIAKSTWTWDVTAFVRMEKEGTQTAKKMAVKKEKGLNVTPMSSKAYALAFETEYDTESESGDSEII